jgi:hypothetical protein
MRHNPLPTLLFPILLAAVLLLSAFAFLPFAAQAVRSNPAAL